MEPTAQVEIARTPDQVIADLLISADRIRHKRKIAKSALEDELMSDPSYVKESEALKLLTKEKKAVKETVLSTNPHAQSLATELDEIKEDLTMVDESIGAAALEIYRTTGRTYVADSQGNERKLKFKISVSPNQLPLI